MPTFLRTTIAALACIANFASHTARADEFAPDRYGVGVTLVQPDGSNIIEIRQVTPHGPAHSAGLLVGDIVIRLDGKPIDDWPFDQVRDYLCRSEPLPVRITVRRDRDTVTVELVRMRFSELAALGGARIEWNAETGYYFVPTHMRPEINVGDAVPLDSLFTPACAPTTLAAADRSTVVYFWATWCGPCKQLITELRGMKTQHRLIAVNLDEKCKDFQSKVDKIDPPGEDLWGAGWNGPLSQVLGVYRRGVPTAALLNRDGRLQEIVTGADAIKEMMKKEP